MDHAEIERFLEERGVKPTTNRILVIRALADAAYPQSLANLEASISTMDKGSIFRVLELFDDKEIVHVIEDGSRSVKYELCHCHSHHNVSDQHVHFYCENCKRTYCLEDALVPPINVPEGFETRSANYVLKGLCPKCSWKTPKQ